MSVAYSYQSELHQAHLARQRRLWGQKKPEQTIKLVRHVPEPEAFVERPVWQQEHIWFDEHVRVYQSIKIQAVENVKLNDFWLESYVEPKKPVRDILLETLEMFPGVTIENIKSRRRSRKIVDARHVCMYEIFIQRPDLSYPAIGRILGFDHTSIMFGVRKVQALRGDEEAKRFVENKKAKLDEWLDRIDPRRIANRMKSKSS